jgi:hypothetical protein
MGQFKARQQNSNVHSPEINELARARCGSLAATAECHDGVRHGISGGGAPPFGGFDGKP